MLMLAIAANPGILVFDWDRPPDVRLAANGMYHGSGPEGYWAATARFEQNGLGSGFNVAAALSGLRESGRGSPLAFPLLFPPTSRRRLETDGFDCRKLGIMRLVKGAPSGAGAA